MEGFNRYGEECTDLTVLFVIDIASRSQNAENSL